MSYDDWDDSRSRFLKSVVYICLFFITPGHTHARPFPIIDLYFWSGIKCIHQPTLRPEAGKPVSPQASGKYINHHPKPTSGSAVDIPPSLGDIPEALPQLLDSNMWTHYNVCEKFSFSAG